MKFQGLFLLSGAVGFLSLFFFYYLHDSVYCILEGGGFKRVNGYYSASEGVYNKIGGALSAIPDLFDVLNLERDKRPTEGIIVFLKGNWLISSSNPDQKIIYYTDPSLATQNIHFPPPAVPASSSTVVWMSRDTNNAPTPSKVQCSGYLENAPSEKSNGNTNIGQLMARPVTTFLLIFLCYYAYYLYSNNIDVSAVSFSYEAIMHRGEYWRMITASISHFELLHLGFNCMGLYQLGLLEPIYGSFTFAYLNIALVFITMIICLIVHYILITRYNRQDYLTQQAVGYSCVLFAWMVALSVRLVQFCPIFLFPTFCMDTFTISLPFSIGGVSSIGFNFGPFLLLIFTQIILRRASFIGHLSGILIGYPLAWNLLNFLHPVLLAVFLTIGYLFVERLHLGKYWGMYKTLVENQGGTLMPLAEAISDGGGSGSAHIFHLHRRWFASSVFVVLGCVGLQYFLFFSFSSLLTYLLFIYLIYTTYLCRMISFYSSYSFLVTDYCKLLVLLFLFTMMMVCYQYFNLLSIWSTSRLLETNGLSSTSLTVFAVYQIVLLVGEVYNLSLLYQLCRDQVIAQQYLTMFRWDASSVTEDYNQLQKIASYCPCLSPSLWDFRNMAVFQQSIGNRLGGQSTEEEPSSSSGAGAASSADGLSSNATRPFPQHVPKAVDGSRASPTEGETGGREVRNPISELLHSVTSPSSTTTSGGVWYDLLPTSEQEIELANREEDRRSTTNNSTISRRSPVTSPSSNNNNRQGSNSNNKKAATERKFEI